MDTYGLLISLATFIVLINANQNERISITPAVEEVIKFVNDSIFVLCNIPVEKYVQWRSPKGEIIKNTRGRVHIESKPQASQLALVFEHISLSDKGNWSCGVEDGVGTAGFNLVVNQRITFVDTNTMQTVREGKEVTIRCEVKGDPEPTVTWSFNGKSLDLTDNMPRKGEYTKLGDGLLIKRVTKNDTGEYTCRAYQISDTISDTQDHTILLKIEHKPRIDDTDINDVRYAYITGEVNLTCKAEAEPPANFTWYRQGKKIDKKTHKMYNEPHKSILNFNVKDSAHLGEYKCIAKNPLGEIERVIKLREGTKPNPPSIFQLRGLNSNTFDVDLGSVRTSKVRELMDVNGYEIQYITEYDFKLNGANWSYAKSRVFPFEDGVTFLINNLEPNTTYLMRAATTNLAGSSSWTKVEKFTTQSNEPPTNSALKRLPINSNYLTQTIVVISIIAVIFSQLNTIYFLQQWNNLIKFIQIDNKNSSTSTTATSSSSSGSILAVSTNEIKLESILGLGIRFTYEIIANAFTVTTSSAAAVLCSIKSTKMLKSSSTLSSKTSSSLPSSLTSTSALSSIVLVLGNELDKCDNVPNISPIQSEALDEYIKPMLEPLKSL